MTEQNGELPDSRPLVVVGDTLLDIDITGDAERLCPDAPVPVVDVTHQCERPGGAGLAAILASKAGHDVVLVTALGQDANAQRLAELLTGYVRVIPLELSGSTPVKTRVRAAGRTLVRFDAGDGRASPLQDLAGVSTALSTAGAVLVADYGRGVADDLLVREVLRRIAREVPVVWDPHPHGSPPVPDAWLATPNFSEARLFAHAAAAVLDGAHSPQDQAALLRRQWGCRGVAVTLGSNGALIVHTDRSTIHHITPPAQSLFMTSVVEACGAGDSFAVAATSALWRGATLLDAVKVAVDSATDFVHSGGAAAVDVNATGSDQFHRVREKAEKAYFGHG